MYDTGALRAAADWLESVAVGRPGATPASVLGVDPDGSLVAALTEDARVVAAAEARSLVVTAELARRAEKWGWDATPARYRDQDLGPHALAAAEIGPALRLTPRAAMNRVDLAVQVVEDLPATLAALADGVIDMVRLRVIADAVFGLGHDLAAKVERVVLPRAGNQTSGELCAAVARAVITADPDAAEKRRQAAVASRSVSQYVRADGTGVLGSHLSAADSLAMYELIDEVARRLAAPGDNRSADARRADAHVWLLLGRDPLLGPVDATTPDQTPPPPAGPPEPYDDRPDPDVAPEPDTPPQPDSGARPESESRRDSGPRPESGPQADSAPRSDSAPRADSAPRPDSGPRADRAPRPDSGPQADSAADADAGEQVDDPGQPTADPDDAAGETALGLDGPGARDDLDERFPSEPDARHDLNGRFPSEADARDDLDERFPSEPGAPDNLDERFPPEPADLDERFPPERDPVGELIQRCLALARCRRPARRPWVHLYEGRPGDSAPGVTRVGPPDGPVAYLEGYGPITIEAGRHLLATGHAHPPPDLPTTVFRATWGGVLRHDPPAAMDREVRARDGTCRFPGCRARARKDDLDHTRRHPDGLTVHGNLAALCRRHHRIKHRGGWVLEQLSHGVLHWTSPTGQTYTTYPRGLDGSGPGAANGHHRSVRRSSRGLARPNTAVG